MSIQELNIGLKFISGNKNKIADHLSRLNKITAISPLESLLRNIPDWQKSILVSEQYEEIDTRYGKLLITKDDMQRILIPKEHSFFFLQNMHEILRHPGERALETTLNRFYKVENIQGA